MKSVKDYIKEMDVTNTTGDETKTNEPRPMKKKPVKRKEKDSDKDCEEK